MISSTRYMDEYVAEVRLDIGCPGGGSLLWETGELERCVERATSDLSRHSPLEKVYEHTIVQDVTAEHWTASAIGAVSIATVAGGGTGYTLNDILTVAGGTGTAAKLKVLAVTDGVITRIGIYTVGAYTVEPTNPVSVTGGSGGDDATFTLTYTKGYITLGNKPIKPDSETVTDSSENACARDTDYTIDYINGRITHIAGGEISSGEVDCHITYKKDTLGIDVATLITNMTRIVWVEYPAGKIPQKKATFSIWEDFMHVGSQITGESQKELVDKEHVVIYYEKEHTPPLVSTVPSFPAFLDDVICIGAGAYAFLNKAVNTEHQCVVDLAAVRAACVNAVKYLNNNSDADAAGILDDITTDKAFLRDAIHKTNTPDTGALFEANALLLEVSSIDLDMDTVGAVAWLVKGEPLINKLNDGINVPENYADYARTKVQIAQVRTLAADGLIQESATRLANLRTYLEQAAGYNRISEDFLTEASQYQEAVANNMLLADRFREEGNIRMAQFNTILASKAEYRKRLSSVPVRQPS